MNNKLNSDLNEFGSDEMIREIFGTPIRMYDPLSQELINDGVIDSFTANQLLSLKNLVLSNWTGTTQDLRERSEPLTTINNTANDFLISSERQIDSIRHGLGEIVDNHKDLIQMILVFENLALVALGLALGLVARVVVQTYSRTFRTLVRLTAKSIEERIFTIKKFEHSLQDNIETKSFGQNLSLFLNFFEDANTKKTDDLKNKEKNLKFFSKNFTIKTLILYIGQFLGVSLVFLIITSGIFAVLYVKSIASFNTLTRINDQLSITNKLSYQSSIALSSFYFYAIFRNEDEYLIRNERAIRQLDKNLNTFGNVNQEILTAIFDAKSHSKNDLVLQDFLQTNLCRHIKSDLRATCNSITQGDRLGLLGFNTRYYKESENYISLLKRAAQNEDFVRTLASLYLEEVTQDVAILDASYNFLTLYILEGRLQGSSGES